MPQELTEFTGFHSVVEVIGHPNGSRSLHKKYGEKSGGLGSKEAEELIGLMRSFQEKADLLGIPVPKPDDLYITPNSHPGRKTLHELVKYEGPNLRFLIQNGLLNERQLEDCLVQVLQLHRRVFASDWLISLDPPLPNFCLREGGEVSYIDRMPPRQRIPGEGTVYCDYPRPHPNARQYIEGRYFSLKQAEVIYAQMIRDVRGKIEAAKLKELTREVLGEQSFRQISMSSEDKAAVLFRPSPWQVDRIRMIAGETLTDPDELDYLYHLTHIDVGGILPDQELIEDACRILARKIDGNRLP